MKPFIFLLAALPLFGQAQAPSCIQNTVQFGTGRGAPISNRGGDPKQSACNSWALAYWTAPGSGSISIEIDTANDSGSGTPGSWFTATATPIIGANPSTALAGLIIIQTYFPWVSVNVTALGVAGSQVTWTLTGSSGLQAKTNTGGANVFLSNLVAPTAVNQNLLFSPDNTFNIGASGATRPAGIFASSFIITPSIQTGSITTTSNCASSSGACGSANAGHVTIAAAATTVTVATTAVHALSEFMLANNSTLGGTLGVTCNTTPGTLSVTTVTAATSFVITVASAPVTNPLCIDFAFVN